MPSNVYKRLTASGPVSKTGCDLAGILVSAASSVPTIKVWDSVAGSGDVVVNTFTPVAGTYYPMPARLRNGCYVTISGTVDCTVFRGN